MATYTTLADFVSQYIARTLGDVVDDYDVNAIAEELLDRDFIAWTPAGFQFTGTDEGYWDVVARHDKTA